MAGEGGATTTEALGLYHEHTADLVVAERNVEADGVISLTLADPRGEELPPWTPGAHVDLILSQADLVRQYSLCGTPKNRYTYRLGVLIDPQGRGGSTYVHERIDSGTRLTVRGPRNHFPLARSGKYIFIAGGIGITPILPMLEWAENIQAEWQLIYGGRTRRSMAFLNELAGQGERVKIFPQDEVGHISLEDIIGKPRSDTLVYCCGPEPLLAAVEATCTSWPAGSLRTERFKAKQVESAVDSLASFEVVCQRSGLTFEVPADKSILDVAEVNGLSILTSCREGVCGTCETPIISGEPDHRDSVLTPDEQASGEFIMICISRSKSPRMVLDL